MKTFIASSLIALSLIAATAGSASAVTEGYNGFPGWAQEAFNPDS